MRNMTMKKAAVATLAVLVCAVLAAEPAFAREPYRRSHVGIFVGVPVFGFGYHAFYPPPYY